MSCGWAVDGRGWAADASFTHHVAISRAAKQRQAGETTGINDPVLFVNRCPGPEMIL